MVAPTIAAQTIAAYRSAAIPATSDDRKASMEKKTATVAATPAVMSKPSDAKGTGCQSNTANTLALTVRLICENTKIENEPSLRTTLPTVMSRSVLAKPAASASKMNHEKPDESGRATNATPTNPTSAAAMRMPLIGSFKMYGASNAANKGLV